MDSRKRRFEKLQKDDALLRRIEELDEDNHAYAIILDKLHKNAKKGAAQVPGLKKRVEKFEAKLKELMATENDLIEVLTEKTSII